MTNKQAIVFLIVVFFAALLCAFVLAPLILRRY
jgi:hypothetical protein